MKKNKKVKKLRLYNYASIGEYESWFFDMAKEGLFLSHVGSIFAYFDKGEPMDMEYRIEFSYKKTLPLEQVEMYEESGWDFCTRFGYYYVFSSPSERNAPEIYSDPKYQAESIAGLSKMMKFMTIVISLSVLLALLMLAFPFFMIRFPLLNIVCGEHTSMFSQTLLWLFLIISTILAYKNSKKQRDNLAKGIAIDHKANWRRPQRRQVILNIGFLIIILFSTIMSSIRINMKINDIPIEQATDIPIVRLANIEDNPDMKPELSKWKDDSTYLNSYTYSHSLLAPTQYTSTEHGVVDGLLWHDKSGTYSPSLRSEIYTLRFKFLAEPTMKELVNKYDKDEFRSHSEVFIHDEYFDDLRLFTDDSNKLIFARKGKALIYVSYYGYKEFEPILNEIKRVI